MNYCLGCQFYQEMKDIFSVCILGLNVYICGRLVQTVATETTANKEENQ